MNYQGLNIGIFTIADAINYGAFYQMFAMVKYLEGRGATVTVYYSPNSLKRLAVKYISYSPARQYSKLRLLLKYRNNRKGISVREYRGESLDVAILGSDEIWNLENTSFQASEYFYGKGIDAQKVVAYAPSIGFASDEALVSNAKFCDGINKIDVILARDENTRRVARQITGKDIEMVCDPTVLLFDWGEYTSKRDFGLQDDYIFYYGYTSTPAFKSQLIELSQSRGMKIITAGHHAHQWCERTIHASPFEFLALLENAKYFFTTTFHGTVMAALYKKNFCLYPARQKVKHFSRLCGLNSSEFVDGSMIEDVEKCLSADPQIVHDSLKCLSDNSRMALDRAIRGS